MALLFRFPRITWTRPRTVPAHTPDGPYKLSVHPGTGSMYVESTIGGRNIPAGRPYALWCTKFSEHCFVIVYVFGIFPFRQCCIFSKCESSKIRVIFPHTKKMFRIFMFHWNKVHFGLLNLLIIIIWCCSTFQYNTLIQIIIHWRGWSEKNYKWFGFGFFLMGSIYLNCRQMNTIPSISNSIQCI